MTEIIKSQRESIFCDRYALRSKSGEQLESSYDEMFHRVARQMADSPGEEQLFLSILNDFRFVPSGRILSGSGVGKDLTYYNCFVIGIRSDHGNDSRNAIMSTINNMVEITARGGGVGINWSVLRPELSYISGVHGHSSGPVGWMKGADAMADQIKQGGSRTAALMFMLDVWHPDITKFVDLKERFLRANFSIGITDDFMKAVSDNDTWTTVFPDTSHPMYDSEWDGNIRRWIEKGYSIHEYDTINARDLWYDICSEAYRLGSPGLAFIDRCQSQSNTWYCEEVNCMNPCGEQPLPINGCCNLGSINLPMFMKNGQMRYVDLGSVIHVAVRFLDQVIDKNPNVNTDITELQSRMRRIGLGVMGLADVLIMKKLRYGSAECMEFINELFTFIRNHAYFASARLAEEKGPAPAYDEKFLEGYIPSSLPQYTRNIIKNVGIRNLQITTQAPTGTTSILAGSSSGIEPVFSRKYVRVDATGTFEIIHPLFKDYYGDHLVTAMDIPAHEHIMVQAAIQAYLDSSVSKTINLPAGATVKDVQDAYELAYIMGCKGITVYRNGSADGVMTESCPTCEVHNEDDNCGSD